MFLSNLQHIDIICALFTLSRRKLQVYKDKKIKLGRIGLIVAVEYFPIENIACIPLFCETGCYSLLNTRCFCEMIREKRLLQLSVDNYKFDKQILPGLIIPKYCELYGQLGFRYHVTKLLILRYSYCLPLSSLMDMFLLKIWA